MKNERQKTQRNLSEHQPDGNIGLFLSAVYSAFEQWERYRSADDLLLRRFSQTKNDEFLEVYEKAALLDRLYGTNVFDVFRIAKHIVSQNIDPLLQSGSRRVVERIRKGHGIVSGRNTPRDLYSFATKYASWHAPQRYPIYDGLIGRLLPKLNRTLRFHQDSLIKSRLKNYPSFVTAIDSLMRQTNLSAFGYKKLDKALWLWAKYEFFRERVPKRIQKRISTAKRKLSVQL
jgi:hypothetical protein